MVNIYFSDFFKVDAEAVEAHGALNISLINDLPVFIDPFLLFNSPKAEYQSLHEEILCYMRFLKQLTRTAPLTGGSISAWFTFPEVKQTWLGFSLSGNAGRGLGTHFAESLYAGFRTIFADFGEEAISHGSHIEKLGLLDAGVGRDTISDFTTNLIKGFLAGYTQAFARRELSPAQIGTFAVPRSSFNYQTKSWTTRNYELPRFGDDFILLTPRDMLTRDDAWINKDDFHARLPDIANSIPDEALRTQLSSYLIEHLSKHETLTVKQERRIYYDAVRKYPQLLDYYIRNREDHGEEAAQASSNQLDEVQTLFIRQAQELVQHFLVPGGFYKTDRTSYRAARERLLFLKAVIENQGGHRLFYVDGEPIKREQDLQILYRITWFAAPEGVHKEVNDGRGPVDFLVTRGARDTTLVELKLASNSHLRRNLEKQCGVYEKASRATEPSLVGILYFSEAEENRVRDVLKNLQLFDSPHIITIDARADNKPSGSRA